MNGVVHAWLDIAGRVTRTGDAPGGAGAPSIALNGRELEGSVLDELGIESAIGRVVNVFKEDTNQLVTDGLAASWGFYWFLGVKTHGGCCKRSAENRTFVVHSCYC